MRARITIGPATACYAIQGGIGGYGSVVAVLAALTSDGAGGTFLRLGDYAGVARGNLHAGNFALTIAVFHG